MKKRNFVRFLCAILALLMLLPAVVSCGDKKTPAESQSGSAEEGDDKYRDNLPVLDYGGEQINFVSRSLDWYANEITVETGDTSDIVDMAVWNREQVVEARLNIDLVNAMIDGEGKEGYYVVTDEIRTDIMAGTNNYDIGVNNVHHTVEFANEGLFWDMNKVPNVELTQPYYSQHFNDRATVSGRLYAVTGDAMLTYIKFAFATFFNRNMAEEYKVPDLYQTVLDGKWTIEYQSTLVKDLWVDGPNGDNKKSADDTFGFITNNVIGVDPYLSAFDIPMIKKNAAGKLEIVIDTDKVTNMLKTINTLFWQSSGVFVAPHEADDHELITAAQAFAQDRALFMTNRLYICEDTTMRNMESLYGIIPMPKYNEDQQQYYSDCHALYSVCVVSSAVPESRLAMVGATVECFFSESDDCRYRLFDEALKIKYQSTEKTGKMLDIIIDYMVIDTSMIYACALNDIGFFHRGLIQKRSSSFAGFWKMQAPGVEKKMAQMETDFSKLAK